MKSKFTKAITSIIVVMTIILTAIPFASAATLLDESKKVSISLNCNKPGYTFEVFKVASLDSTSTTPYETKYTALVSGIETAINSGKTADILKALDGMSTLPTSAVSQGSWTTSATSTSKTFSNLAQGIYYIKAIKYPAGVKSITNSVVALPYFSNNSWVYSVPAINLATKVADDTPTTKKVITNSTKNNENYTDVSLGDTVNFKLTNTTAGSSSMKLTTYTVKDDMSKGLTLNNNSFSVYLADKNGTKLSSLTANDDYKVNITKQTAGENTTFNVALTETYLAKNDFYASNVTSLVVTYTAKLNKYAVKGIAGNPNEDIELEYGNSSGTDSVPGNTVYVYTYGVGVTKLNEKSETLAGATFKLFTTEANANALQNSIAAGTSDSNGIVTFKNSSNEEISLASGSYYIVETEAPEGYNVYGKVIPIDIDVTYSSVFTNNTWVQNAPANGIASCTVTDTVVTVPQTGGYVQYLYIGGAVLVIGGLFILGFTRKRTNKK